MLKYESFSFFELKGIKPKLNLTYPFVNVIEKDDKLISIEIWKNENQKSELVFQVYKNFYYTFENYKSEEGLIDRYTIYNNDTIESFSILKQIGSEKGFLTEYASEIRVDEFHIEKTTKILPEIYEFIDFNVGSIEEYKQKLNLINAEVEWKYKYEFLNDIIKVNRVHNDCINVEVLLKEDFYYNLEPINYFWLNYFYYEHRKYE